MSGTEAEAPAVTRWHLSNLSPGILITLLVLFGIGASLAIQRLHSWDDFSQHLVVGSLERYAKAGDADIGGFMLAFDRKVHIATTLRIAPELADHSAIGYVSNYGLQYDIENTFLSLSGWTVASVVAAAEVAYTVAFYLLIALFLNGVRAAVGYAGMLAAAAPFLVFPLVLETVGHVYWVTCTLIAPMCVLWWLYPKVRGRRLWVGVIVAWSLTCIRSLCGHEFASTLVISTAVPVIYYELLAARHEHERWTLRSVARVCLIGAAGTCGVLTAMALHVATAARYLGTWPRGLQAILTPFTYSTLGNDTIRADVLINLTTISHALQTYMDATAIGIPFGGQLTVNISIQSVVAASISVAMTVGALRLARTGSFRRARLSDSDEAFAAATGLSVLAALSWWIAVKHNIAHTHINFIILLYFPVPMLLAFSARLLQVEITENRRVGRS